MIGGIKLKKAVLSIKHLTKRFPGVVALKDVSFNLYENEILSLVGENGAGKSTLMKILSGSYTDYEGSIELDGKPVKFRTMADAQKAGIAMIFQELNVELDLSIAENIFLGIYPKKKNGLIDWKKIYSEASSVLARLGMNVDPHMKVRMLGASMQQMVCIARALVHNLRILILDEPTAMLTEGETEKLIRILYKLRSEGISCIYISHKLDEVFEISDRVIAMRDGRYISEVDIDQLVPAKVIEDMVGRHIEQMYPESNRVPGETVLQVKHLKVRHPYASKKNILEDVSFEAHRGEIVGLAGLVGSGRSELMRAIFGVLPSENGEVIVDGKKAEIQNAGDAIALGIGYLTEERKVDGFVGTMSIRENMTLSTLKDVSRYGIISSIEENKRVQKYYDYLRIKAPSIDTGIVTLSGGNQQKVILAKSLMADLKVLMLDEPTRGIDVGAKAEIYKIMNDLADMGMCIIMVSSELPELIAMSDRLLILSKGKIIKTLKKGEAEEKQVMKLIAQV